MYTCIKDRAIDVRLYLIEDFNKVQVTCGKKLSFPQLPPGRCGTLYKFTVSHIFNIKIYLIQCYNNCSLILIFNKCKLNSMSTFLATLKTNFNSIYKFENKSQFNFSKL